MDIPQSATLEQNVDEADRRFFQPDIETMPRDRLAALQERRLLELLPTAYEKSPFYRELWSSAGVDPSHIRSIDDFTRLIPTFTKDDIRAYRERTGDPFGGLLQVPTSELTSITSTSGTSGAPELIPDVWKNSPPLPTCSTRDLWEIGVRPGDLVIVPAGTMRGFYDKFYQEMGLVPVYIDTWVGQGEQILATLRRFRPSYVNLMLPTFVELEKLAATHDIKEAFSSVKGVAFAGQPLGAALATKVREEWGIELFTYASAGDTGTAWECREHNGYHLWEDLVFAETLETDSLRPVAAGTVGELVATDLDNRAAPLIRYRSGDLVRIERETCACGRTHARQWIVARTGDETVVEGKPVVLSEVWAAIESQEETDAGLFQIIRESRMVDRLRLRVGYQSATPVDLNELAGRLREAVVARVGVSPEIELVPVDDLLAASTSTAKFPRMVKA